MNKVIKKILLVLVLLVIIAGIAFVAINASKGKKEAKQQASGQASVEKIAQDDDKKEENEVLSQTAATEKNTLPVKEEKLSDGIKYSVRDTNKKPDVVLKDNYYDTQISEINLNFETYEGKTMEIEGFYFENGAYTFVGRYSTSNLCPYCPTGYSYFEYEWHGDEKVELKDSDSWIKVIGTLKKGNDGVEYYYIDADSIEIMNERGQETVTN